MGLVFGWEGGLKIIEGYAFVDTYARIMSDSSYPAPLTFLHTGNTQTDKDTFSSDSYPLPSPASLRGSVCFTPFDSVPGDGFGVLR